MRSARINSIDKNLGFQAASALAAMLAEQDAEIIDPVLMAWHDYKSSQSSPVLEGCAVETSWHDYGESHAGALEVNVDGEYDFIFADSGAFEPYGPSPYVNLRDPQGNEYLCQNSALGGRKSPSGEACTALDEWTSKLT